ncbi:NUMOD4 domain-containing protein [Mycolicibacterium cosmeticum]|uniref:NUMOD4 domain-containing protein n=1 Tax=Mycolicibacterium cosmeticum TaxID=258533 RepID=UPI0038996A39
MWCAGTELGPAVSARELWRPVDGWAGFYEVSNHGRVRSVARVVTTASGHRRVPGRILRLVTNDGRAPRCTLARPGQRQTYYPNAIGPNQKRTQS